MRRYEEAGTKEYRKDNKRVQKVMKKAIDYWIYTQCKEIEVCCNKNRKKRISTGKESN